MALCLALLLGSAASAADPAPAGRWKTYDDKTGRDKSIVVITSEGSELAGHIERVLDEESAGPDPLCDKCPGELENQPVEGMQILRGLRNEGAVWAGGTILDPENGKTYKVTMKVLSGGKRMEVRGYIGGRIFGFAPLGRTQYWDRLK